MKEMVQRELAWTLWLAAKAKCVDRMNIRPKKMVIAEICPQNAFTSADRLVGASTQGSDFGGASTRAAQRLGIDSVEEALPGPRAKMAGVADNAETIEQIQKFEAFSGRSNISESCDLNLKCVAAGIRCWGTFGDLRGRPHFPPKEQAVLARSAYFPAGSTFQQYLPHLE